MKGQISICGKVITNLWFADGIDGQAGNEEDWPILSWLWHKDQWYKGILFRPNIFLVVSIS